MVVGNNDKISINHRNLSRFTAVVNPKPHDEIFEKIEIDWNLYIHQFKYKISNFKFNIMAPMPNGCKIKGFRQSIVLGHTVKSLKLIITISASYRCYTFAVCQDLRRSWI